MTQPPSPPQPPQGPQPSGHQPPPGYPPQQGYPGAPVPPPSGHARVIFDASFFWMMWILFFTGPTIVVNGNPIRASWGKTPLDLPAGQHRIEVYTRYLWKVGKAETFLNLAPGQQVPLFYRPPAFLFMRGALGHEPQKTPGIVAVIVLSVVLPLLIFLIACLGVAANEATK